MATTLSNNPATFSPGPAALRHPAATDVPGAVQYTGQSRATLYKDMRSGVLPAYKKGVRTVLFYDDLDRYLRALPRATFKPVGHDGISDVDATLAAPSK